MFATYRVFSSGDNANPFATGAHVYFQGTVGAGQEIFADATKNFKLISGAMVYRVNTDNTGKATGVNYYGPNGSDETVEADLVIVAPFIYDNTRLLLLSSRAPASWR